MSELSIKRLSLGPTGKLTVISHNGDEHRFPKLTLVFKELDEHFVLGKVKWVIQKY